MIRAQILFVFLCYTISSFGFQLNHIHGLKKAEQWHSCTHLHHQSKKKFWCRQNAFIVVKTSKNGLEDLNADFSPVIVNVEDKECLKVVSPTCWNLGLEKLPVVIIKPSFAWGEGTHPSTYMCLQYICERIRTSEETHASSASVLDYGTGSGVLAIAAKRLGAREVLAIDKDDEILSCAEENADLNFHGTNDIEFLHARDLIIGPRGIYAGSTSICTTFDVVVANMLPAALIKMASTIVTSVKEGKGVLALSGMRRDQVEDVKRAYEKNGVTFSAEKRMEGAAPGAAWAEWVLLEGRVPRRNAEDLRARLDYLSDAAVG